MSEVKDEDVASKDHQSDERDGQRIEEGESRTETLRPL